MNLYGKRSGRRFKHPLFAIDEKPSDDILIKLHRGEGRDEAIIGYTRLALKIVGVYLEELGSDRLSDDLTSAAIEGLILAINKPPQDNLTGHVASYIHKAISEALNDLTIIRVPSETRRRHRKQGKRILKREPMADIAQPQPEITLSYLLSLCKNDLERSILTLRSQYYTYEEVADELNVPKTRVFEIVKTLETRLET